MTRALTMLAAVAALAMTTTTVRAEPESGVKLSGQIALVSDYRYRGYSLSGEDPVIQGGLNLDLPKGIYAGVWASEIEEYGVGADGDGAQVEVDLSVGRAFTAGGLDWDVGALRYAYPDGSGVDYWELSTTAARTWGAFTGKAGIQYAPDQDNLGGDNTYLFLQADWAPEHWPVALEAVIGREDGVFADGKFDWSLQASKTFGPVTLNLIWTDADAPDAEGSLSGGITLDF